MPAADLNRAMRFYSAVFGANFGDVVTIHDNKMAYFPFEEGRDGASGALVQGDVYVPARDGAIIYLSVQDIDDVQAKVVAQGSAILFPKTPINEMAFSPKLLIARVIASQSNLSDRKRVSVFLDGSPDFCDGSFRYFREILSTTWVSETLVLMICVLSEHPVSIAVTRYALLTVQLQWSPASQSSPAVNWRCRGDKDVDLGRSTSPRPSLAWDRTQAR